MTIYIEQLSNGTYALCHGDTTIIETFDTLDAALKYRVEMGPILEIEEQLVREQAEKP